jgi:hypothetical protein
LVLKQFDLMNKVFYVSGQPLFARCGEQFHGLC